jgi:tRNA pseudouridine38-40 synthase
MLNRASRQAFGFECNVTGCSRTDSGVHALGYCLTVEPKNDWNEITIPVDKIPIAMNVKLPRDISVLEAREVGEDFHQRYSVKMKEYVYKIHDSRIRNPFYEKIALEYGKEISNEAVEKMTQGAQKFLGTHQFDAFMATGSKIEDTTRTVYFADVKRNGDLIEFTVRADGFLYNMVRIMVGTLLDIEKGKINENTIPWIINLRDRKNAGGTAKPDGLYLKKIFYK